MMSSALSVNLSTNATKAVSSTQLNNSLASISRSIYMAHYILLRQRQTQNAYLRTQQVSQSQPLSEPQPTYPEYTEHAAYQTVVNAADTLFGVLLIALNDQLAAGHTVLILENDAHHTNALALTTFIQQIEAHFGWQHWQTTLIMPVLTYLQQLVISRQPIQAQERTVQDTPMMNVLALLSEPAKLGKITNMTDKQQQKWRGVITNKSSHIVDNPLWQQLLSGSYVSISEKAQMQQIYDLYQHYKYFCQQFNALHIGVENSLSKLIQYLSQHPSDQKQTTSNRLNWLYFYHNQHHKNHNLNNINTPFIVTQITTKPSTEANIKTNNPCILWLHRTWTAEYLLAHHIQRICTQSLPHLNIDIQSLQGVLQEKQIAAIKLASNSAFSIITGGPGTGKTYTVAQIVLALFKPLSTSTNKEEIQPLKNNDNKQGSELPSLALAAPTGKAAQRMQESLQNALSDNAENAELALVLENAQTIHRLLGIGIDGVPRYHQDNPLPYDVVVIDEASMLGVELANHLVAAIKPHARLILLGDANQLAAVDAGAVLSDLCQISYLTPYHIALTQSRRFDTHSGIGQLASIINQAQNSNKFQKVQNIIANANELNFYPININNVENIEGIDSDAQAKQSDYLIKNSLSIQKSLKKLENNFQNYFKITHQIINKENTSQNTDQIKNNDIANKQNLQQIFAKFNQFRILCAGHNGQLGDLNINQILTTAHRQYLELPLSDSPWYHGRPIMLLANDYELGLFNGDIGICLYENSIEINEDFNHQDKQQKRGKGRGQLKVWFETRVLPVAINRLSEEAITTAYAMTIHKSQGSEFDKVAVAIDIAHQRLLSQELIYTAITRAKKQVDIYSTPALFRQAVTQKTQRQTGLALHFAKEKSL
ncbi:exodeoxyribonuclease V subunit alpha [Psychrobacter sp. I-STPA10]|uniref:exodeoxyribonuclease V subunit alpha n=1 Tax=Psychrobacter sp. I-STPA10 TaxID=2585769 RepID=UPI001E65A749|nr:exodeoxyribonuclease V subunit alpha [Psychrobacter sp. I-STPA10]